MLHVSVPGRDDLALEHLILDSNGTLTLRGEPLPGLDPALSPLRGRLGLHLVSADTFGTAEQLAATLGMTFRRVASGDEKRAYAEALGAVSCAAIGNGRNDAAMLSAVALGFAVIGGEGAHSAATAAADVIVSSVADALALLADAKALAATLRP